MNNLKSLIDAIADKDIRRISRIVNESRFDIDSQDEVSRSLCVLRLCLE